MKRIYTSSSLWQAREIRRLLDERHIAAILPNEHVAGTPGVVPVNPEMTVDAEVWVLDDADEAPARRVVDEYLRRDGEGPRWTCRACGEENPGTFEWCWACGESPAPRDPP